MIDVLNFLSVLSGVIAAGFGVAASRVHVRNEIDHFMSDIHRQSWWASLAATAAAFSAILQAAQAFLPSQD